MNTPFLTPRSEGCAIGLMSGTSGDGIDAALVHFHELGDSGFPKLQLVHSLYRPFTQGQRAAVSRLFAQDVSARYVAELDVAMGQWFGTVARDLMQEAKVSADDVLVIGSHGQTVCHHPDVGTTLQIGDPVHISQLTGCPVVSNFRRADLAYGGQGAPLVPYFDYLCYQSSRVSRVLVNIGGIANVTILKQGGAMDDIIAFDTGPGNMVLDEAMQILTDGVTAFDQDGACAGEGTVEEVLVEAWLSDDEFLLRPPPKSTGREVYGRHFTQQRLKEFKGHSLEDQMATLTWFVAKTIAQGIRNVIDPPFELLVSGGGCHNETLRTWLQQLCCPTSVVTTESFGVPSDFKEAMAFALFAWQFTHGRWTNVPNATGASRPLLLGQYTPAQSALT